MISMKLARLAGLAVLVTGTMVAGDAEAGGWRSRRNGCCRPACCERVEPAPCRAETVANGCCNAVRMEPRVHHHMTHDACGRSVCVEHVTMAPVWESAPIREVVVEEREVIVMGSVCCSGW